MTRINYLLTAATLIGVLSVLVPIMQGRGHTLSQDKKPDLTEAKYFGVSTCNKCHADSEDGKPGKWATDFVLMNEFTTWRTKDKHALAFAVLEGPRGQQIGKLLEIDVTKDAQCLNCHATTSRPARKGKGFNLHDGVSCDGCHGPAQHWIIDHALEPDSWRVLSPQQKEDLGLYDLRNPAKRAQMCMSCHVGNAAEGKVVTHAMFAAGHPPLPGIEVANFTKNMPQHWRNAKDVPFFKKADAKVRQQNYAADADFQQTKFVLASSVEALRSMMELIANRATHEGKPREVVSAWPPAWLRAAAKNARADRWPELPRDAKDGELAGLWPEIAMAQSDCFACHHDLKSKSWRQLRGYNGKPGRPQFQPWAFVLAPISIRAGDDANAFVAKRKTLRDVLDATPFGNPRAIAAAALELEMCSAKMLPATTLVTRGIAEKVLRDLLALGSGELRDYDSARQIAWATRVVFAEWKQNHVHEKEIDAIFVTLDHELNLSLQSDTRAKHVQARWALTADLAKSDKDFADKIQDKAFLNALQKINDQELTSALARINDYDAVVFRRRMQDLANLVFVERAK